MAGSFEDLLARTQAGDSTAAPEMVELAEQGHPGAAFIVGEYRLLGRHGRRDLADAYRLISLAAEAGHADALRARAYLTAKGIGRPPDPEAALQMLRQLAANDRFAAVQLQFLDHVTCEQRLAAAERRLLSRDPFIMVIPGLFSPAECRYLQLIAAPWLQPAMIVSPGSGEGRRDPVRDSDGMAVAPLVEDLVVQSINRCIAAATGTDPRWGEPLAILRYGPGQQYKPHHDAYHHSNPVDKRQLTALVWLNDGYEGGETHFPELKLSIRGAVGDMLVFANLTGEMEPDPRMMHAGLPVTRGEKWLASRWIRSTDYLGER